MLLVTLLVLLTINSFAATQVGTQALRLNVLAETGGKYKVGKLKVCSYDTSCLYYNLNNNLLLSAQDNGSADFIGAIALPIGTTVNTIEFLSKSNNKNKHDIDGVITLTKPLTVEEDLNYQAIFKLKNFGSRTYPTTVNTHYYRAGVQTLYYNPNSKLNAVLDKGVKLKLPAHASKEPLIFTAVVHDVGQSTSMIDLMPYMPLENSLTLTMPVTDAAGNISERVLISNQTGLFDENSVKPQYQFSHLRQ